MKLWVGVTRIALITADPDSQNYCIQVFRLKMRYVGFVGMWVMVVVGMREQ